MNVLAMNASPKMDKGNTALILNPFLDGMREAGAKVELFYIRKLDIHPCQGEQNCWFKTPGSCFQKDDMQTLLPRLRDADVWVWATPLYCEGLPGPMKTIVDRMLPLLEPYVELRDGHCAVRVRADSKAGKLVLVASCGFWEIDNFDRMVAHVRAFCGQAGRAYAGALLRPHAGFYSAMLHSGAPVGDVAEAACEAGRQLVRQGHLDPGILQTVGRALLPVEAFVAVANQGVQEALAVLNQQ